MQVESFSNQLVHRFLNKEMKNFFPPSPPIVYATLDSTDTSEVSEEKFLASLLSFAFQSIATINRSFSCVALVVK